VSFKYQILLFGNIVGAKNRLVEIVHEQTDALGIARDNIVFLNLEENQAVQINQKSPLVAVFFGYSGASVAQYPIISKFILDSVTIIPCVSNIKETSSELPEALSHINAFVLNGADSQISRLATLILENLCLLRAERRLFISYRRIESQSVAIQLYELFDAAGFDVFLDTRSVPYAADFQSVLWHRMADSDLVVLLDTPQFRDSGWTQAELARANATNIQILHLLWPTVAPDQSSAFSQFLKLKEMDFLDGFPLGERARMTDESLKAIIDSAESLRARALAARHRNLVDNFCDRAREEAIEVSVQPERFISIKLNSGERVAVVPTIGVPRADRYHDMEKAIRTAGFKDDHVWLLYDERGVFDSWVEHLKWLDSHLPVTSVQVSKCSAKIRAGV
jgi:TIR domain